MGSHWNDILWFNQECWTKTGLTFVNLSTFVLNNFYFAINCLNIKRVPIYRAKFLGIVTWKVLPTNCFCLNSEGKSTESPYFENESKQLMRVSQYKLYNKMFREFWENGTFLEIFLSISKNLHIHFNHSQSASRIILLNGFVMVTNKGSIAWKCFK